MNRISVEFSALDLYPYDLNPYKQVGVLGPRTKLSLLAIEGPDLAEAPKGFVRLGCTFKGL